MISKYREMEVRSHFDPELSYIAEGTWSHFISEKTDKKTGKYKFQIYKAFRVVGRAIAEAIAERENVLDDPSRVLTESEAAEILWQYYESIGKDAFKFEIGFMLETCIPKLVEMALARAVLPSIVGKVDYWPELKAWAILKDTSLSE